jgi:hypothetical protein
MKRRHVLIGLGAAAGSGAVLASGAFTSVTASRDATVEVASDATAFLQMKSTGGKNSEYVVTSGSDGKEELGLAFTSLAGKNGGDGLGQNSTYTFDDLFLIQNQGTQDVEVTISGPSFENSDAIKSFTFTGERSDADASSDDLGAEGLTIGPGDTIEVSVVIETGSDTTSNTKNKTFTVNAGGDIATDTPTSTPEPTPTVTATASDSDDPDPVITPDGEDVTIEADISGLADGQSVSSVKVTATKVGIDGETLTGNVNDGYSGTFTANPTENAKGTDVTFDVTAEFSGDGDEAAVGSDTLYVPKTVTVTQSISSALPSADASETRAYDILDVQSGTYQETVTVKNPVRIRGPNAGTPGSDGRPPSINPSGDSPTTNPTRSAEAFIVPPSPDPTRNGLVTVKADDVVIDGFTLSGFNPFSSAVDAFDDPTDITEMSDPMAVLDRAQPANLGADYGVQLDGVENATVANNVVRAFGSYGVFGKGAEDWSVGSDSMATVEANLVTDLPGVFGRLDGARPEAPAPSLRTGVRFVDATATVEGNTMSRVFIGVEGMRADLGAKNNFVESERVGIRAFQGPTTADIDNNYLDTFRPESFQNAGIWFQAVGDGTATGNTIANSFSGVEVFNTENTESGVTVENTAVDRCLRGIYAYNYADVARAPNQQPSSGSNPAPSELSINGAEIRNCLVGIFADDRRPDSSDTDPVDITVNSADVDEPGDGGPSDINKNGRAAVDENVEDALAQGADATINDPNDSVSEQSTS